jgi:3,4-dihydroxy-9,10-secoandrosta-1,3,5(10)-triene-9,17-dione 4,5-dioxygenase
LEPGPAARVGAPRDIRALGYVRFEATDLDAWERFLRDGLDMEVSRAGDSELRARIDERPARLVVTASDADRLASVGWEAAGLRALARVSATLEDAGVEVRAAASEELADRRVEAMVHVDDPGATHLEIYAGPALDHRPLAPRAGSGFVAGELGLGHVVLPEPEMDAAMEFYEVLLGFQHRDSMRLPGGLISGRDGEKGDAWIRFLGCNARHHSLALFEGPAPSGIVHLMVEVEDLDQVGRGLDRCRALEAPMSASLGRHTNDHMVSFYVGTPGGFDVEYGTGGRLVDAATWVATEITAVSYWGHRWGSAG